MAKEKIPIPDNIAAEILFLTDRTCCKCNIRGKGIQIHHIDENPANNIIDNLAPLCLDCHSETMISGGFTRQLDASQVIKYREDWISRVKSRRDKADELASLQTVTGVTQTAMTSKNSSDKEDFLNYKTNDDSELLKNYLHKILVIHQAQLTLARIKWGGTTLEMNQGNGDMIDFYEEILIELSTFYPKGHFNNLTPKKYFSEIISLRFQLHWHVLTPHVDKDTMWVGTMYKTMVGGQVMRDLRQMIIDMVEALTLKYGLFLDKFDIKKWREQWQE